MRSAARPPDESPRKGGVGKIKRQLSATFVALRSRDFRLFAIGQVISACGSWMQKLAQAWLVLVLTDSAFMLGLSIALQQLPTLFLTASGGAMADRFSRRLILIITSIGGAGLGVVLGTLIWLDLVQVWMVMAAVVFQGLVEALEMPTRMTFVNDITHPRLLTNAVTLNNVIQDTGKLIGPAAGGILIGTAGVAAPFFVNAASYVPVIIGLLLIRPAYVEQRTSKSWGRLRETLVYVAERPELAATLGLIAVVGLFAYNFSVLLPLLFRDVFGGGAEAVGFGPTCMGLGGVVGGLAVAGRLRAGARRLIKSAAIFGVMLMTLALAPTMWLGFVAVFAVGMVSVTFKSASASYVQLESDPYMRGRVMGFYVMALIGSSAIGGPMVGAIAELTSARVAFMGASCITLVACLVAYRYLRARRAAALETERALAAPDMRRVEQVGAMVKDVT